METNYDTFLLLSSDVLNDLSPVEEFNRRFDNAPTDNPKHANVFRDHVPYWLRDYVSGEYLLSEIQVISGYGVRSTAPGYMDCTDWQVFDSLEEAEEAFREEERQNRGEDEYDRDEDDPCEDESHEEEESAE